MEHYLVPIGSTLWISGWIVFAGAMMFSLTVVPSFSEKGKRIFEKIWAVLLLAALVTEHTLMLADGQWDASWSLPIQMCSMSGLLGIYTLLTHNRKAYLFVLFWGVSGGIHSLLTPEMTLGYSPFHAFMYYLWHISIIVIPIYFFKVRAFGLRRSSFFNVLLWTHVVWISVGLIDAVLEANYMYILQPPQVDNPFILGDFPYHLIGFEFAGILHFGIIALLFSSLASRYKLGLNANDSVS